MVIDFHYKQLMVITIALLCTFHILLLYALPVIILFVSLALFTLLYSKMDWHNSIMLVISISLVTLAVVGILKVTGLNHSIYYRPQEMFSVYDIARNNYHYKENINFEMTIAHGDLKAFDTNVVAEPRHVFFQTDSYGFRNAKDFHGQKYVLVGDSFVAGNGISQQDLITEQLQHYGIDSYNLANPGRLSDYIHYIKHFEKTYGKQHKFILFLYEGNDFGHVRTQPVPHLSAFEKAERYVNIQVDRYKKIWGIENTDIYRFMSTYIQRISYHAKGKGEQVDIQVIKKMPVAFYMPYVSVSRRTVLPEHLNFERVIAPVRSRIAHIFFIPTKYRVYYKHLHRLNPCDQGQLPDRQWEYIQSVGNKLGIKTTDLTPALIEASDDLLPNNRLTYWKDDTHWNKYGVAAAVKVVSDQLSVGDEIDSH